jgi:hypothetical protein
MAEPMAHATGEPEIIDQLVPPRRIAQGCRGDYATTQAEQKTRGPSAASRQPRQLAVDLGRLVLGVPGTVTPDRADSTRGLLEPRGSVREPR